MMPLSGPYGTEVRIVGSGLGSAAREGVTLTLGATNGRVLTPDSTPEIVSWSESEIVFRYPFPIEAGSVEVATPQGTVVAGDFEPTWIPGPSLAVIPGAVAIASLAPAAGSMAAVLDTGPPRLVEFDGAAWSESEIVGTNLRADSVRLYLAGTETLAFALSTAAVPEIIALDPAMGFTQTPSGVTVSTDYRVAGGHQGASVWFREGNNWSRARPTAGVWAVDKGPIADPNPTGARHAAATTSDGTLYVGYAKDTSPNIFDNMGAIFFRALPATELAFTAEARAGSNIDDSVTEHIMRDRGAGIVARYCGTNVDPLGITGTERLCRVGLLPSNVRASLRESTGMRYAFSETAPVAAYCSPTHGVRLLRNVGTGGTSFGALDALSGDIVAWPCPTIVAVEADETGDVWMVLELDGALYSPRPRVP
jgi:hypothetical protein